MIIAIDGYSSTGKSTYARMIAQKLNYLHIDSGAMYRAVTFYALEKCYNGTTIDYQKLIKEIDTIHIEFKTNKTSENEIYLNNININKEIRSMKVSNWVSEVSKIKEVREYLMNLQREIGETNNVVMDGRDIGTIVFPDASLKFFIIADFYVRVQRRLLEYQKKKITITKEEVIENLKLRDYLDTHREISPLIQASDAILIDNSYLTLDETFDKIYTIVKSKLEI